MAIRKLLRSLVFVCDDCGKVSPRFLHKENHRHNSWHLLKQHGWRCYLDNDQGEWHHYCSEHQKAHRQHKIGEM